MSAQRRLALAAVAIALASAFFFTCTYVLNRAAAMQSEAQAGRSWIGHSGADGSTAMQRARSAGYPAKIASENVAAGQKSFADVLAFWTQSSGHRTNLLRPNVSAIGVAMAKNKNGRAYWTLVLGGQ